jgi:hypothetical protein
VAIGTALTLVGLALVQAAIARALVEIDQGRAIGPVRAYRLAWNSVRPLLRAILLAVLVVSLLATTVVLIPVAVWLTIRWALIAPVVELEKLSALAALRRSGRLVALAWLKVASLIVVGAGIALLAGPFVGALLILVTSVPFSLLNIISGLVYVVTMPFVALATAYVYFDMRARDELAVGDEADELPAEVTFST